MNALTPEDIKQRLIRLQNLERLYPVARARIAKLEVENTHLKVRIKELESKDRDTHKKLEDLSCQLEQIKNKLFGKKPSTHVRIAVEKKLRDSSSYHRPIPEGVTETRVHPLNACTTCNGVLVRTSSTSFYVEDIPLPIAKTVVKHEVETGYCTSCRKQSRGYSIPSKKAVLGENIKKYVCILSIAHRLSHSQIQDHITSVFAIHISIGEIGNILMTEANNLRPEYQALKASIIAQAGTHYDETSWKVQKEEHGQYAWVGTGTDNNDTVFDVGKSRGKGNIADIGIAQVGISDDYGAYKHSFSDHQLCWAHPHRKLRDLSESGELDKNTKKHITATYHTFRDLYYRLRKKLGGPYSAHFQQESRRLFDEVSEPHVLDPLPLIRIKDALRRNTEKYFTFFKHTHIPLDNNKAERALRHLVIKRRTSFGSKTQRGAETTSILASVILSLKWNKPDTWFTEYVQLGRCG